MEQGTGSAKHYRNTLSLQILYLLYGLLVMVSPDILSVYKSCKKELILREALSDQILCFFSFEEV